MQTKSKVLVVDSSESTRIFTRFTLNNDGHRASVVSSGARALDTVKDEMFDVFVVNTHLSDMDGLDLVRELRLIKAFQHTPILMLNELYSTVSQEEGEQAGVTHWLTKPISPHKLLDLMRELSHHVDGQLSYYDEEEGGDP